MIGGRMFQQDTVDAARGPRARTIPAILSQAASSAPAIGAPGRPPLSYGALRRVVESAADTLAGAGIERSDTVAIVAPNGPEMAAAFVAITSAASAAPLNPAYRADEFDFYLKDLAARAVAVQEGHGEVVRQVCQARGIPVIDIVPQSGAAGNITLAAAGVAKRSAPAVVPPRPSDTALVLHTSGTTARPKMVPLTHANLTASAYNIATTLSLGGDDICLNIMPLFHIHGLVAAVLATLASEGLVVCCPGLNGFRFFGWLAEARASWFTAVPTMHQSLLALVGRHRDAIAHGRLRLVRSSSASLPVPVMAAMECGFDVPLIEAYGMTEASHQIASNRLPPGERAAGSVGFPSGPSVAILDETGAALPAGQVGEVAIRGENVTGGYVNNPDANAKAFTDGWFRTGDQGCIDPNGSIRLTGRLKEIINRAGEKVSPLEVDGVLMQHPDVHQALAFAMPSALFGEDVAAAVVLREGADLGCETLRRFVADRLASFKVPREIVFLDEIPKGATGKLQRVGLAARLGMGDRETAARHG